MPGGLLLQRILEAVHLVEQQHQPLVHGQLSHQQRALVCQQFDSLLSSTSFRLVAEDLNEDIQIMSSVLLFKGYNNIKVYCKRY